MKAIVFNVKLNSLYSIRIPFTWQSALTYPILPPSAVIGMVTNALQRYKNDKHPLKYLDLIEENLIWAGSRLLTPCIIKSYITSAIVKWEDRIGGKFTNALGRQYAYTRELQIAVIIKEDIFKEVDIDTFIKSIKNTPLTCGDSESPISVEGEIFIKNVIEENSMDEVNTEFPIPYTKKTNIIDGYGQFFRMHERCKKDKKLPLTLYLVPIKEESRIIKPSFIKIKRSDEKILKIEDTGYILISKNSNKKKDP